MTSDSKPDKAPDKERISNLTKQERLDRVGSYDFIWTMCVYILLPTLTVSAALYYSVILVAHLAGIQLPWMVKVVVAVASLAQHWLTNHYLLMVVMIRISKLFMTKEELEALEKMEKLTGASKGTVTDKTRVFIQAPQMPNGKPDTTHFAFAGFGNRLGTVTECGESKGSTPPKPFYTVRLDQDPKNPETVTVLEHVYLKDFIVMPISGPDILDDPKRPEVRLQFCGG